MNNNDLRELYEMLSLMERKEHASKILNYDMETQAPKGGMEEDSKDLSELNTEIFRIRKSQDFIMLVNKLYRVDYEKLSDYDKVLVEKLYKEQQKNRNVNEATEREASDLYNQAYITWLQAKQDDSYAEFAPTLEKIAEMEKRLVLLRDKKDPKDLYASRIDDYEEGFTTKDLDTFFDDLEAGIVPLLKHIRQAVYKPKHNFLNKPIPIAKQEEFTKFLLSFNGFDFNRGSISTTEHPFTEQFGKDDVRITTKYMEDNFTSNMYTVIHEGGHALFGQNLPEEVFTHHLGDGALSMGKHESVSRFYENILGKSKEYIHAIYPTFHKIFHKELGRVSEQDLYEAVNYIHLDNPLRTEADELTYTLHIIIRYRLEKEMMNGNPDFATLNQKWNEMYKEILGVDNTSDRTGILQDVHWCSGFGYFPTYAIGNALGCMYAKTLDNDIHLKKTLKAGKMDVILSWMKEHVFKEAAILDTKTWIKKITGEEFSAKPYLEYLTKKYTELYHLNSPEQKAHDKLLREKEKHSASQEKKNAKASRKRG